MAKGRTNKQGGASVSLTGDAVVAEVLNSKTFYNTDPNTKLTGTMPNKVGSATVITPSTSDQAIPQGYYGGASGDGKVSGDANLVAGNIKSGVEIYGVTGNYSSGGNWTNPTLDFCNNNYTPKVSYSYNGSGVAYIDFVSNSNSDGRYPVFFTTSISINASGNITLDGVALSINAKCYGLSKTQTSHGSFVKTNYGTAYSYTGGGICYYNHNRPTMSVYFHTSLVVSSTTAVTIDGVPVTVAAGEFIGYCPSV